MRQLLWVFLLPLVACGQTGPLYLPDESQALSHRAEAESLPLASYLAKSDFRREHQDVYA